MTEKDEINPFESPQEAQISYENLSESSNGSLPVIVPVSVVLLICCTVLLLFVPGLGVLGFLVSIPGIIHGAIRIRRKQFLEGAMTRECQFNNLLISLLIMVPVVFASMISFGVFCYGGAIVATNVFARLGNADYGWGIFFLVCILAGLIPALAIGTLLFIFTLPKKMLVPRDEIEYEKK
ncbi:MAG: hypothetical protein COA78_16725 [Blastopirellula sp.]|nr:MAG: hypothetical protein COA78_16725 [Blastopirellula sp.]